MNPDDSANAAQEIFKLLQADLIPQRAEVRSVTAPVLEPKNAKSDVNVPRHAPQKVVPAITECYDQSTRTYYKVMPGGVWVNLSRSSLKDHLVDQGYSAFRPQDCPMSDVDSKIVNIEKYGYVDFVGGIAGHSRGVLIQGPTRVLVPSEAKFITPKAGSCAMLLTMMEKMFRDQLVYILGWIKIALNMFSAKKYMAGHVLVLCGEPEAGKTLFTWILQQLFGGRAPGKPYDYMTKGTIFNADLIAAELLTIEDEAIHKNYTGRSIFAASIKNLAVTPQKSLHRKHSTPITVCPLQRCVITCNSEPESMQVLPPLDHTIADKVLLIKVYKSTMPMPTTTPEEHEAFSNSILAELPHFVHYLQGWAIPINLVHNRCGMAHYHHPELLDNLEGPTPERRLLVVIDEVIFSSDNSSKVWTGKASALEEELRAAGNPAILREVEGLLRSTVCCGQYLGRVAQKYPHRVTSRSGGSGIRVWTILRAPEDEEPIECLSEASPELLGLDEGRPKSLLGRVQAWRLEMQNAK